LEFRDLVLTAEDEYTANLTHFSYRQGHVLRDAFGRVMERDYPQYGCAHIAFTLTKYCGQFYRKWAGKTLTDGVGISSKLVIDFALNQRIAPLSVEVSEEEAQASLEQFKETPLYQNFIKCLPKPKEQQLASSGAADVRVSANEVVNVLPSTLLELKFADLALSAPSPLQMAKVTPLVQFVRENSNSIQSQNVKKESLAQAKSKKSRQQEKREKREKDAEGKKYKKEKAPGKNKLKAHPDEKAAVQIEAPADVALKPAVKPEKFIIKKREVVIKEEQQQPEPSTQEVERHKVIFRAKGKGRAPSIKDQLNAEEASNLNTRLECSTAGDQGNNISAAKKKPPKKPKKPKPQSDPTDAPKNVEKRKSSPPNEASAASTPSGIQVVNPKVEFVSKSRKEQLAG